jgi:hypothetical protein
MPNISEHTKHLIDWASVMTVIATLATWLPSIAALFSIIWTVIRIWETDTAKSFVAWLKRK